MFSILQKPQESVNAEDLESLQNEIEKRLAHVVTQRWQLEQEHDSLIRNTNPNEPQSQPSGPNSPDKCPKSSNVSHSTQPGGKSKNPPKLADQLTIDDAIDVNSSDSTTTVYTSNNGTSVANNNTNNSSSNNNINNNNNKHETESISSESSLTSNLTGSTIITSNLGDLGSHQQSTSTKQINPNKRSLKSSNSDRPPKRFRPNGASVPKRLPHMKQQRAKVDESRPLKKQLIKNEAPDKLWPFVDQFCATPNNEQIKDLERMINALEDDKEYYMTPNRKQANDTSTNTTTNFGSKDKGNPKKKMKGDNSLGALTQRLVSSFIEESEDDSKLSGGDDTATSPSKRSKGVSDMGNVKNLERKVRQLLEEYSILTQQDDIPYSSEEDEHSRRLRAYQHELLTIQTQNQHYMQILLKRAKRHIELEREREKLREASADVISVYQRFIQAKQKKKSPTKKDKDAAWKALRAHDAIFKKCEELYLTNRLVSDRRDFPDL